MAIGAIGGIASWIMAGAAAVSAGAAVYSATRKPEKPKSINAMMPTEQVEKKEEEEDVTLGSDRGNDRRGRKTGRATLMAEQGSAPPSTNPGSGVKL